MWHEAMSRCEFCYHCWCPSTSRFSMFPIWVACKKSKHTIRIKIILNFQDVIIWHKHELTIYLDDWKSMLVARRAIFREDWHKLTRHPPEKMIDADEWSSYRALWRWCPTSPFWSRKATQIMAPRAVIIHIDPSVKQNNTPGEPREKIFIHFIRHSIAKEARIQEIMNQATILIEMPTTQSKEWRPKSSTYTGTKCAWVWLDRNEIQARSVVWSTQTEGESRRWIQEETPKWILQCEQSCPHEGRVQRLS